MSWRTLLAAATLSAAAPAVAAAQIQVYDPINNAQLVSEVAKSAQQILLLQTQLEALLRGLQAQDASITPALRNVVGDLDKLLKSASGVGYSPSQAVSAYQSTYPAGLSGASGPATLADWRQKTWAAHSDLVAVQSLVAAALSQNADAAATAVDQSQAAPGPTAAIQSTNQLLAAISGQLGQVETLIAASSRATASGVLEQQSVAATASSLSVQALQSPTASSRLTSSGHL